MKLTLQHLRRHAIAASLFPPTTLPKAMKKLGFVQADPIRSPARAQDLILRHRVTAYHAGDLEARYPSLRLEEDFLYAYGFLPQATWQLLHPRREGELSAAEQEVLALVRSHRQVHPRELEAYLGREREVNAWGGYSKTTTRILQTLHYRGLLRVAGRENGVRLYEPAPPVVQPLEPGARLKHLILLIASILQPVSVQSLRSALQLFRHGAPDLEGRHSALSALLASGELVSSLVDGIRYTWPAGRVVRTCPPDRVCFLAPFDPVVWDRARFEHFWSWRYRFEAYTPVSKRKLGYYALPLLWRDDVVGWVNIANGSGQFSVQAGFAKAEPTESEFRRNFEAEVERFRRFLLPRPTNG